MLPRPRLLIILLLSLTIFFAVPVYAGGWAVITLDQLPTNVTTNQAINIGFTVLQHGKIPLNDLDPTIMAELSGAESVVVHAKPDGKSGHYTAKLTFPQAGHWSWTIHAFTMEQPMPPLDVAVGDHPTAQNEPAASSVSPLWLVRIIALMVGVISLSFAWKNSNRKALALTGLCLIVELASFATGSAVPEAEAQSKSSKEVPSISQLELGEQLFIAKGCVTCHVNNNVSNDSEYWIIDIGAPDLTNYSAEPGYLDKWLFKPSALKPATQMPDLHLSKEERAALIAFINSR